MVPTAIAFSLQDGSFVGCRACWNAQPKAHPKDHCREGHCREGLANITKGQKIATLLLVGNRWLVQQCRRAGAKFKINAVLGD